MGQFSTELEAMHPRTGRVIKEDGDVINIADGAPVYFNKALVTTTIRAAAALTDSYVAATIVTGAGDYNMLLITGIYTKGSLTSLNIKIETSVDGTDYVAETVLKYTNGVATMYTGSFNTTEDGNFKIAIPITATHIKVSAQGVGTVTDSSLKLTATLQQYV